MQFIILLLCLFSHLCSAVECRQNLDFVEAQLVNGSNGRTFETFSLLYPSVVQAQPNILFSGLSLNLALSMVAFGAVGESKAEIKRYLRMQNQPLHYIDTAWERLLHQVTPTPNDNQRRVNVANALWVNSERFRYSSSFLQARSASAFAGAFNEARTIGLMHDWFTRTTQPGLAPFVNKIAPDTVALLLNTVYLKAPWLHGFAGTQSGLFTDRLRQKSNVTYLINENFAGEYTQTRALQMLSMSLGSRLVMDVVLPSEGAPIDSFIGQFGYAAYQAMLERQRPAVVDLRLPKFKARFGAELRPLLRRMGINRLFVSGQAELYLLGTSYNDSPMGIDSVVQRNSLEVNEDGLHQAEPEFKRLQFASMPASIKMHLDRPFLFILRDRPTRAILMHGLISDPAR